LRKTLSRSSTDELILRSSPKASDDAVRISPVGDSAEDFTPSQRKWMDEIRATRRRRLAKAAQTPSNSSAMTSSRLPSRDGSPLFKSPGPDPLEPRQDTFPAVTEVLAVNKQNDPPTKNVATGARTTDNSSGLPDVVNDQQVPSDQTADRTCMLVRTTCI
jgi:hypothetical protein